MNLPSTITAYAATALLAATAAVYARMREPRRSRWFLVIALLILAAMELFVGFLMMAPHPQAALGALRGVVGFALCFPAPALAFFVLFGRDDEETAWRQHRVWIIAVGGAFLVTAFLVPVRVLVADVTFVDGSFAAVTLSRWGEMAAAVGLVTAVGCLFFVENTFRAASLRQRVMLKYPLLGSVTSLALTVYLTSHVVAVAWVDRTHIGLHALGLVALCTTLLFAGFRYQFFTVRLYIGRDVAVSSASVIIAGLYLLALAGLTYFAKLFGIVYERFTFTLVAFFALFLLVAVLMSGRIQRRIRYYVSRNFYANRYDYRGEWARYSQMMARSQSIDEFLESFISLLCETMLAAKGYVWVDVRGGRAATYGLEHLRVGDDLSRRWMRVTALEGVAFPNVVERGGDHWVQAAATIGDPVDPLGVILLGEKSLGHVYTDEDREFLSMLAAQAAMTVENFLLEERIIDSRQMDSFNRLASFVVHDVKNTANMLALTVENAQDNIADPAFQRDFVDTVRRSLDKMRSLIFSLSVFRNPPLLATTPTDLSELAGKCVEQARITARARGVDLEFVQRGAAIADVDAAAVERVVENILINAIDATPSGGRVRVRVAVDDGAVELAVTDTGPGFNADYLGDNLFRPFQSTKKDGMGIGLYMCKTVVDLHRGDLQVRNEPGGGATVTLRLEREGRRGNGAAQVVDRR